MSHSIRAQVILGEAGDGSHERLPQKRLPLRITEKAPCQATSEVIPSPPASIAEHTLVALIASGSYGEVWLAQSRLGTYRAVKIVRRSQFADERPYEREFHGIEKFEPVSRLHEGLMDVLLVGQDAEAGYFYYVMELADDVRTGAQIEPEGYVPCTLTERMADLKRIPARECVALALRLTSALDFLHRNGLTHRDIKPSNIIFVNGSPKLADIGLVTDLGEAR